MKTFTFKWKKCDKKHVVSADTIHKARVILEKRLGQPLGPRAWYMVSVGN